MAGIRNWEGVVPTLASNLLIVLEITGDNVKHMIRQHQLSHHRVTVSLRVSTLLHSFDVRQVSICRLLFV